MRSILVPVVLGAATLAVAFAEREGASDAGGRWWQHVLYLADDRLEGRKAGTPGYDKAAEYVASEFRQIGLQPGGTKAYLQPIQFETRQLKPSASSMALLRDGKERKLTLGSEALISPRGENGTLEAELVFVGNGLQIPELKIDDLAGLDVRDKIAVVLKGAPKNVPGPLSAHSQSTAEQWRNLRNAGAIGLVTLYNPASSDIPWARYAPSQRSDALSLADPKLVDTSGQRVSATVGPEAADVLLAGTGHTLEGLLKVAKSGQSIPRFAIPGKLRVQSAVSTSKVSSPNVIGIRKGSGPRKDEYLVISAHLDHLGVNKNLKGDQIFNGAMDNAAGIASLLEVARMLQGAELDRSVVFAAATAEEGGLMGSKYFASYPTVPKKTIVANVNLDMYLPIIPLKAIMVGGIDESSLGDLFREVAARHEVGAERDPEPQRNGFIRSDQYSFIRRGIPALTFGIYAAPGTPEWETKKNWRSHRYHAPNDDVDQPVDKQTAARFNGILADFVKTVANASTKPAWKESSFFRRYANESD